MRPIKTESLEVQEPCQGQGLARVSPLLQGPHCGAKTVKEEYATGPERRRQWCVIGGIAEYQGRDAERQVRYHCGDEAVAGDST